MNSDSSGCSGNPTSCSQLDGVKCHVQSGCRWESHSMGSGMSLGSHYSTATIPTKAILATLVAIVTMLLVAPGARE
jgi:hypothetical protein